MHAHCASPFLFPCGLSLRFSPPPPPLSRAKFKIKSGTEVEVMFKPSAYKCCYTKKGMEELEVPPACLSTDSRCFFFLGLPPQSRASWSVSHDDTPL